MVIWKSAYKHGCSSEDIKLAMDTSLTVLRIGEDPDRRLYMGFDTRLRPLEIVTVMSDDGVEVVIHAMKLRKKYYARGW